jgi:hypothetical protein
MSRHSADDFYKNSASLSKIGQDDARVGRYCVNVQI